MSGPLNDPNGNYSKHEGFSPQLLQLLQAHPQLMHFLGLGHLVSPQGRMGPTPNYQGLIPHYGVQTKGTFYGDDPPNAAGSVPNYPVRTKGTSREYP
jgi:hypothetical protein